MRAIVSMVRKSLEAELAVLGVEVEGLRAEVKALKKARKVCSC